MRPGSLVRKNFCRLDRPGAPISCEKRRLGLDPNSADELRCASLSLHETRELRLRHVHWLAPAPGPILYPAQRLPSNIGKLVNDGGRVPSGPKFHTKSESRILLRPLQQSSAPPEEEPIVALWLLLVGIVYRRGLGLG